MSGELYSNFPLPLASYEGRKPKAKKSVREFLGIRKHSPKDDRPKDDRPKDDRPKDDRPKDDRPKDDRPNDDKPNDGETNYDESNSCPANCSCRAEIATLKKEIHRLHERLDGHFKLTSSYNYAESSSQVNEDTHGPNQHHCPPDCSCLAKIVDLGQKLAGSDRELLRQPESPGGSERDATIATADVARKGKGKMVDVPARHGQRSSPYQDTEEGRQGESSYSARAGGESGENVYFRPEYNTKRPTGGHSDTYRAQTQNAGGNIATNLTTEQSAIEPRDERGDAVDGPSMRGTNDMNYKEACDNSNVNYRMGDENEKFRTWPGRDV